MTKKQVLIAIGLGAVSIGLTWAYWQFQKIKDYCISMNRIKLKGFSFTYVDMDLYMNFLNKSKLNLSIISQEYLVYLNNVFVSKISNIVPQAVKPNSISIVSAKIQFSPKKVLETLKKSAIELATSPETIKVKISANMKIGYGILKFNVNYDYNTNLKELLLSETPNSSAKKC